MKGQDGGGGRTDNDNLLCYMHFPKSQFKNLIFPVSQIFTSWLCGPRFGSQKKVGLHDSKLLATVVPSKCYWVWNEGWKKLPF